MEPWKESSPRSEWLGCFFPPRENQRKSQPLLSNNCDDHLDLFLLHSSRKGGLWQDCTSGVEARYASQVRGAQQLSSLVIVLTKSYCLKLLVRTIIARRDLAGSDGKRHPHCALCWQRICLPTPPDVCLQDMNETLRDSIIVFCVSYFYIFSKSTRSQPQTRLAQPYGLEYNLSISAQSIDSFTVLE